MKNMLGVITFCFALITGVALVAEAAEYDFVLEEEMWPANRVLSIDVEGIKFRMVGKEFGSGTEIVKLDILGNHGLTITKDFKGDLDIRDLYNKWAWERFGDDRDIETLSNLWERGQTRCRIDESKWVRYLLLEEKKGYRLIVDVLDLEEMPVKVVKYSDDPKHFNNVLLNLFKEVNEAAPEGGEPVKDEFETTEQFGKRVDDYMQEQKRIRQAILLNAGQFIRTYADTPVYDIGKYDADSERFTFYQQLLYEDRWKEKRYEERYGDSFSELYENRLIHCNETIVDGVKQDSYGLSFIIPTPVDKAREWRSTLTKDGQFYLDIDYIMERSAPGSAGPYGSLSLGHGSVITTVVVSARLRSKDGRILYKW